MVMCEPVLSYDRSQKTQFSKGADAMSCKNLTGLTAPLSFYTTLEQHKMDKITDGLKHYGGKARLDLVPPEIIEAVGAVMTHGAEKYGEGSYRNVEPKRYRAALMRHICKWLKNPHGTDEDSGLPHLWHIACNVAFLLELDK